MQKWKCHKIVEAGKISNIIHIRGGELTDVTVRVDNGPWECLSFDKVQWDKLTSRAFPVIGDYLVRYEDGYLSWSPAEAFESGYTKLEE